MTRIDRITHMEALFDKSDEVVRRLDQALEDFAALQPAIAEGVLSEDGLWNLLGDYQRLKEITKI